MLPALVTLAVTGGAPAAVAPRRPSSAPAPVEPSSPAVRNVVFTLTRGDETAVEALVESRRCLLAALGGVADGADVFDHVVLHEGNMAAEALAEAGERLPDVRFVSIADRFVLPSGVPLPTDVAHDAGAVGYRHMCSFMSLEWFRVLSRYEYAMRVDEDVRCSRLLSIPRTSLGWVSTRPRIWGLCRAAPSALPPRLAPLALPPRPAPLRPLP